jgi:hypothetical protein
MSLVLSGDGDPRNGVQFSRLKIRAEAHALLAGCVKASILGAPWMCRPRELQS